MLGAVLLLAALAVPSAASCGSSSCPAEPLSREDPSGRWASIGYEFEFTPAYEARVLRNPAVPGEVRGHHDERYTVSRVHRAVFGIGWGETFALEAMFPWVSRSHGHIHNHRGAPLGESWSFDGLGDIELAARKGLFGSPTARAGLFSALAGVKFHTGEEHMASAHGEADIGVEPGTGSTDFIVGAAWQKTAGRVPVRARASYRANGPGRDEYRMGDVVSAGASAGFPLAFGVSATAGLDWLVRMRDYKGKTTEETGKTGGESVWAAPGLSWSGGGWTTAAAVRLPVYRRVNSIQVVPRWALSASLARRFAL